MKTKVICCVFNRPDLLDYQIRSLKKFIVGDLVISVAYDTRDEQYYDDFKKVCEKHGASLHLHVSKPGGSPSFYHGQAAKWAYENLILSEEDDCIGLFLDHDMFLIDDFNPTEEMFNNDVMGCLQSRGDVNYIWPGLFFCKKSSVEDIEFDFFPQTIDGQMLDTGGGTYKLLRAGLKYEDTGVEYPEEYKGIDLQDPELTGGYGFELHCGGKFLHFRNACSWHNGYEVDSQKKTEILFKMLSDLIDDKEKSYLEIVVARYNEDLRWSNKYKDYLTVYNKGDDEIEGSIRLENIGRESHTYLYHIINNYDNLADYTIFLQGGPLNPHSPNLYEYLNYILHSNENIPDFFWISTRIVEGDFDYEREPYHKVFPNIRYAFEKVFGDQPPENLKTFKFGSGAQFCVSRDQIRKRSKEFYQNIFDIFEYSPEEPDELTLKLLGNTGPIPWHLRDPIDSPKSEFCPIDPEMGYQMERFWGLVFTYEV
jgi:hypothetical protein